jgi:hypothetical protein
MAAPAVAESPPNTSRRSQPICSIVSSQALFVDSHPITDWFEARVAAAEPRCKGKPYAQPPFLGPR